MNFDLIADPNGKWVKSNGVAYSLDIEDAPYTVPGTNLFNPETIVEGQAVNHNFDYQPFAGYAYNKITCLPLTTYTLSGNTDPAAGYRVRFEDASGFRLIPGDDQSDRMALPVTFDTPSGCVAMSININPGASRNLQLEAGTFATTYAPYTMAYLNINQIDPATRLSKQTADSIYFRSAAVGKNLFNKDQVLEGWAVDNTGQLINEGVGSNFSIITIPVRPSTTYTCSGDFGNTSRKLCYLGEAHNLLGFVPETMVASNTAPFTFTTPLYSRFVVLCVRYGSPISTYSSVQVEVGALATPYEPFKLTTNYNTLDLNSFITVDDAADTFATKALLAIPNSDYISQAKTAFFGDSIVYFGLFIPKLVTNCSLATYQKFGYQGFTVAPSKSQGAIGALCDTMAEILAYGAEVLVISGGANDFLFATPIGNIADTDKTTFYGAYNYIIQTYLAAYPNSRINLWTPLQRGKDNSQYAMQIGYVNAIKALGAKYNLPVTDQFHESGIRYQNITQYSDDGSFTHPNQKGGDMMANAATANFLRL